MINPTEVKKTHSKNESLKAEDFLLVYSTVPDEKTGETLSRHLLSKKLMACANLLPQGQSFYEWEGKIQSESEQILICKTTKSSYPKLEKEIKKNHPYKCPCIVALPLSQGYPPFLKWIQAQCF